jgi:hypothetical protein
MALTNTNVLAEITERYNLDDTIESSITVYRSKTATFDQMGPDYLLGEGFTFEGIEIKGTIVDAQKEVVIIGDHTLVDADSVWTEYNPEMS